MDAYHIALEEGSVAYLDTQAPYFDGGSGTIWEHIKQSIRFTTQNMGAHGFPLMLTSVQATAELIDSIWTLLSEKGYISQEDALKSDHHWPRLRLYARAPWRKADRAERGRVCAYQLAAFCAPGCRLISA